MKKSDLLKLLEEYPDDLEITFYDSEYGEYIEKFKVRGIETVGRFRHPAFSGEFYAKSRMLQSWEYMGYTTDILVLERD